MMKGHEDEAEPGVAPPVSLLVIQPAVDTRGFAGKGGGGGYSVT